MGEQMGYQYRFQLKSSDCFRCVVSLSSLELRCAAVGLGSQPIVEPPPGAVPAVARAHTQLPTRLAYGGITTVRARWGLYPSARGQWSGR